MTLTEDSIILSVEAARLVAQFVTRHAGRADADLVDAIFTQVKRGIHMTDDVLTEEVDEVDEWVFVCPWCQRSNDIHDAQCIMSDTEEFDLDSDSE